MTHLTTARLTLRPPAAKDVAAYVAFYTSERRARTGEPVDTDTALERFDIVLKHWGDKGFGRFLTEERTTGQALGLIGPHFPDDYPEAEIAWHIWTDAAEGRGIAYEAAEAARDHAFGTLGWRTAVSYIRPGNHRSIALARRLGATLDTPAPAPDHLGPHLVYRHPAPEARI